MSYFGMWERGTGGAVTRAWRRPALLLVAMLAATACGDDPTDGPDGSAPLEDGGGPPHVGFAPSNVSDRVPFGRGMADVVVGDAERPYWLINTDDGSIEAYPDKDIFVYEPTLIREQGVAGDDTGIDYVPLVTAGGASLGVFSMGRLTIPEGMELIGIGSRALVILVTSEARIDGVLSVGADYLPTDYPGPGGFAGAPSLATDGLGPGHGLAGAAEGRGGGGASYGGLGGHGGKDTTEEEAGLPGSTYGTPELVPLLGGSGGGSGGPSGRVSQQPRGGGGGGALQLGATQRIVIGLRGVIDACGAGGRRPTGSYALGGGGGGSGGAVLLEAPIVEILGIVGANGGSGGQGNTHGGESIQGVRGDPGHAPVSGPVTIGGAGGGGAGSDPTGQAADAPDAVSYGGGGGGGAGRIRINTEAGTETYPGLLPTQDSGLVTMGRIEILP